MRDLTTTALAVALASLVGCRTNPCGDQHATLPPSLAPVGAALDDAPVCYVQGDRATLMYWGGADRLNTATVRAIGRLNAAGWAQLPPSPYADPAAPVYVFARGDEEISLRFSRSQTPRLGAKMLTDSVTIQAGHSPIRRRAHP